ncbi:MAG: hypothetical protein FWD01_04855 [Defluviitaleaceae bacterium]|nr:hypothetical protein [Defluviitaleaceae bacterium]
MISSYLISVPGIIIAVIVHEYVKALADRKLSSEMQESMATHRPYENFISGGRSKVKNPFAYIDILGFVMFLLFRYGWAQPARLSQFSYRNRKLGMLMIFLLPFSTNIIIGAVSTIISNQLIFAAYGTISEAYVSVGQDVSFRSFEILMTLSLVFKEIARFNIAFALFNIIPIYPLDGNLLLGSIRPTWGIKIAQHERILQMLLALFILLGWASRIFEPAVDFIMRAMTF